MTGDRQVTGYDPRALLASRREAPPFVDHCTEGLCGEPASSWLASRPGEAWCGTHAPPAPSRSIPCPRCAYLAADYKQLADHAYGHVEAWRSESMLAERARQSDRIAVGSLLSDLRDFLTTWEQAR